MDEPSDLQKTFSNLVSVVGAYECVFALIDLLVNTFHAYILSRRHMRTSSMNSILLGIALVDMIFPIVAIKKQARLWVFGSGNCTAPQGSIETNIDWILYTVRDDFRRCSTWLGLSLAVVRTVAVRNTMNQSFNYISRPAFGWKVVVASIGFSSFLSIFYYLRFQPVPTGTFWQPSTSCPGYTEGYQAPIFVYQEQALFTFGNAIFRKLYLLLVGMLGKFVPCAMFPVVTILLIRELAKARKSREKATKDKRKKDLTTRLVIYMTISFFIIEFPIGICLIFEAGATSTNTGSISTSIIQLLNMVYVLMTLTHFSICFFMSSQYRRTVNNTILRKKIQISMSVVSVIQNQNQNQKSRSETSAFR